jgi:hypothetical protein
MLRGCHPLAEKPPESNLEWLINDNIQRLQNLVIPPGIRARSESSLTSASTLSVTHPWKLSKTNMVCLHNKAPGCLFHTTFNHSRISFSVIHHLSWTFTIIPGRNFSFWKDFLLNYNGEKLWPSMVTTNVTVACCLSAPVILTSTYLWKHVGLYSWFQHVKSHWSLISISNKRDSSCVYFLMKSQIDEN